MSEEREALDVLRDVWSGQSQDSADIGDGCEKGSCTRVTEAGVGFESYAGATEEDRAAAWRARLEREGKLNPRGSGLRDLVLGKHAG